MIVPRFRSREGLGGVRVEATQPDPVVGLERKRDVVVVEHELQRRRQRLAAQLERADQFVGQRILLAALLSGVRLP